ncbi:DUF2793 domain-containing protein [Hirschia maritima]|uniref:DUF2793 domain-containing protein n=1 Tax=Hirschia maritima TaxID=1121961 RepID=UPI00036CEB4C|nr:DUF2793 domain-containing protein [Hirschia maritima]
MEHTTRLSLPYIHNGQAQKHVTHNEAIRMLDLLVQASVETNLLSNPPSELVDGQAWLVAENAEGDWQDHSADIAYWVDNSWMFFTPQAGWKLWNKASQHLLVFDGTDWQNLSSSSGVIDFQNLDGIGIKTGFDSQGRLQVKSEKILFSHEDSGGGDVRQFLNKQATSDTASIVWQNNYSTRVEIGLTGDDAFRLKISPDGNEFNTAMLVDNVSGRAHFPFGVDFSGQGALGGMRNLLINPNCVVNQREFSGGQLPANTFGYDRWKAGATGCFHSVTAGVWTLNGQISQNVELPQGWPYAFTSDTDISATFSIKDVTGSVTVTIEGQSFVLTAQSGGQSVEFTLPASLNNSISIEIGTTESIEFSQPQLELSSVPTPFEMRSYGTELAMCQRYFYSFQAGVNGGVLPCMKQTTQKWRGVFFLPEQMRADPDIAFSGRARIYSYNGVNTEILSIDALGLKDRVMQVEFNTETNDPPPGLATFFAFDDVRVDFSAEM